jgi:uncharacterized membrane protein YdfJ with MMPL/SSD domain
MNALLGTVLRRPALVAAIWALLLVAAGVFALRLPGAVQGSSGNIEDSESGRVAERMQQQFGKGSAYLFPVVVQSDRLAVEDPRFAAGINAYAEALEATPGVGSTGHSWNTGSAELLGRDRRSALILVRPTVDTFFEAENLTARLRTAVSQVPAPEGMTAAVTGMPALFHDLNRNSSSDLLRAERIGIPLTLAILLIVFGAPLAALLPLAIALVAVTIASAGLYLLSDAMPVSVFAQNVVGMIGLGIGVDYALFLLAGFRSRLARGATVPDAVRQAVLGARNVVLVSGLAVAIGFTCLLLVNAKFLHSVALAGLLVVAAAVLAVFTLLPVLLLWLGPRLDWPRASGLVRSRETATHGVHRRWIESMLRRPWLFLLLSLAIAAALAMPALRMKPASASVNDLAPEFEARRGFESIRRNFEAGWMGPVAVLIEARHGSSLRDDPSVRAIQAIVTRLQVHPSVARVQFDPRLSVSADGNTAVLAVVTRDAPDAARTFEFVRALRADAWSEAARAGLSVRIGGPTAMIEDFDAELFGSLWRVIPAVLAMTFVVLMIAFRSLAIPAKAIALNLVSVMAAYGFLVLLFQDGVGASWLGIDPPGGLTSLVVLMLFTILFGISMDYEVFLMRQIRDEYARSGDNRAAVVSGVERSAGLITSAAAIMVVLFGSFGFTGFTATREFGLGLAFAVALDATLVRLVMAPALMELCGVANWWLPARWQGIVWRSR